MLFGERLEQTNVIGAASSIELADLSKGHRDPDPCQRAGGDWYEQQRRLAVDRQPDRQASETSACCANHCKKSFHRSIFT